jgi:hypothetical protein
MPRAFVAQSTTGQEEPNGRAQAEMLTSEGLEKARSVLKGAKRRADKPAKQAC